MKDITQEIDALKHKTVEPFKVGQAMAGMKLNKADVPLLNYLHFLSSIIQIEATYFLHVVPKLELFHSIIAKSPERQPMRNEVRLEKTNLLKEKILSCLEPNSNMEIEYEIREGDRLEELLTDVADIEPDLLVIGKEDKKHNSSVLAKNLIRKVKCNSLVVPEKARYSLKKILVPIDFSPYSIRALHTAIGIAKQMAESPEVICLNVYQLPNIPSYNIIKTNKQFHSMVEKERKKAFDAYLHTHAHDDEDLIQQVLLQREMPRTPHYIKEYADENEVDLIVMGAKGHSRVELLFIGSVTEKLMTLNNSIPTLIVK